MNKDVRGALVRWMALSLLLLSFQAGGATRWDNPLPQGNILADIAWNGTRYVAVGNIGTVLESTDGVQWRQVTSGTEAWLQALRWTGSQFIAVGNSGTILVSANGLQWTRQASGTTNYLYGVEHINGLTVVVGSSGTILVSDNDGASWSRVVVEGVPDWLNDVAWNGSEFIAVGEYGTVLASADGRNWTRRQSSIRTDNPDGTASGPSLEGVAWNGQLGRWVAVSEVGNGPSGSAAYAITSTDGVQWSHSTVGDRAIHAVIAAGNRFVAVSDGGRVMTSTNGTTWSTTSNTGSSASLESVTLGGGEYVAVGSNGIIIGSADPTGTWTRRTTGSLRDLASAAFYGGGYVAVGDGLILRSADATVGAPAAVDNVQGGSVPTLNGVAAGTGGYVAVGRGGTVVRSADGVNWSYEPNPAGDLNAVVRAADGAWVAVGANGTVIRNTGQGWSAVRSGGETLNAIAADSSGLVVAGISGTDGVILTSSNGTQWSGRTIAGVTLFGVAAGNGRRVAVGSDGTFLTQAGGDWTQGNVGSAYPLYHVTWDGARFVAVGREGSAFVSTDGLRWTRRTLTGNQLLGAAANSSMLLAVGKGGTVIRSACPCAADDYATTSMNRAVTIDVLANDQGSHLSISAADAHSARGGRVQINGNGTLTYNPAPNFTGNDVFNYTVGDGSGAGSNDTASVTVAVSSRSSGGGGSGGGGTLSFALLALLGLAAARRR